MDAPITFRQNVILYYAMLAGQLLFVLIIRFVFIKPERGISTEFSTLIPIIVAAGVVLALFVKRKGSESALKNGTLSEKMDHYRRYLIVQLALLEGANLLALVLSFLDNNPKSLLWFYLGLLVFLTLRPNRQKFQSDYNLSQSEMEQGI